jgi:hypothetical protein
MPNTDTPAPDECGNMKNTWAIHQLFTTSNFAPKNWLVGFYTGGKIIKLNITYIPILAIYIIKK